MERRDLSCHAQVVLLARHMADLPTYFSTDEVRLTVGGSTIRAGDIVTFNVDRDTDYEPVTPLNILNDVLGTGRDPFTMSKPTMYEGCSECYNHSMRFGQHFESEEEFEIHKMRFVEHFNEKHRDIMMKREKHTKKTFKKVEESSGFSLVSSSLTYTSAWAEANYRFISNELVRSYYGTPVSIGESFYSLPGSRVPEYDVAPEINVRNLDRNARFRHNLQH